VRSNWVTRWRGLLDAGLFVLGVLFSTRAHASEDEAPPVSPERPDLSYNATMVKVGAMQWEMGFDNAFPPVPSTRDALEMPVTLRIGVHRRVELQPIDGELLPWLARSEGPQRGVAFAVKIRLNLPPKESKRPRFVLRPHVESKILGAVFDREAPSLGLFAVMSQPLGEKVELDLNAGGQVDPNPRPDERFDLRGSASLIIEATSWLHPLVELYVRGDPTQWRDGTFTVNAGFIFELHPTVAIDFAGRADILANERAYAMLGGATFVVSRQP
jgi:hypothetical protein